MTATLIAIAILVAAPPVIARDDPYPTIKVPPPIHVEYLGAGYTYRRVWICSVSSMVADHEIAVRGRLRDRRPIGKDADTLLTIDVREYLLGSGPDQLCLRLLPKMWWGRQTPSVGGQGWRFEAQWFRLRRLEIGDEAIFWIQASLLAGRPGRARPAAVVVSRAEIWPIVSGFVTRPAMFRSLPSVRGDIQTPLRGPAGWKRRYSYRLIPTDDHPESAVTVDRSKPLPLWVRVGLKLGLIE